MVDNQRAGAKLKAAQKRSVRLPSEVRLTDLKSSQLEMKSNARSPGCGIWLLRI